MHIASSVADLAFCQSLEPFLCCFSQSKLSPSQVLYDQPTGRLALVFELMDMNIYELIRGRRQQLPHEGSSGVLREDTTLERRLGL